jgi:hypothetical protein
MAGTALEPQWTSTNGCTGPQALSSEQTGPCKTALKRSFTFDYLSFPEWRNRHSSSHPLVTLQSMQQSTCDEPDTLGDQQGYASVYSQVPDSLLEHPWALDYKPFVFPALYAIERAPPPVSAMSAIDDDKIPGSICEHSSDDDCRSEGLSLAATPLEGAPCALCSSSTPPSYRALEPSKPPPWLSM